MKEKLPVNSDWICVPCSWTRYDIRQLKLFLFGKTLKLNTFCTRKITLYADFSTNALENRVRLCTFFESAALPAIEVFL